MPVSRAQFRDTVLMRDSRGALIVPGTGEVTAWLYDVGTTTPIGDTIYSASSGGATLANPVSPDADGTVAFWLDSERELDLVVTSSDSSQRLTVATDAAGLASNTWPLLAPDGSAAAPSYSFAATPGSGMYAISGTMLFSSNGNTKLAVNYFESGIQTADAIGFGAGPNLVANGADAFLWRDAANTLAQRNATNAQTLRVYRTYTDASNYDRVILGFPSGSPTIGLESAGSGGTSNLNFRSTAGFFFTGSSGLGWVIDSAGFLLAQTDNSVDIGASSNQRPRNVYVGTNVIAVGALSTGVKAGVAADGDVSNPTNGMLRVDSTNNRLYVRVGGAWKFAALT